MLEKAKRKGKIGHESTMIRNRSHISNDQRNGGKRAFPVRNDIRTFPTANMQCDRGGHITHGCHYE